METAAPVNMPTKIATDILLSFFEYDYRFCFICFFKYNIYLLILLNSFSNSLSGYIFDTK